MASFSAIRAGLATRLNTIDGWQAYAKAPGDVVLPCVVVLPANPFIEFDQTMARGSDTLMFNLVALVGNPDDDVAQDNLDIYLDGAGVTSIKEAVDSDLGGIVSYARVVRGQEYGEIDYAGGRYLGATFLAEVVT